MSCQRWKRCVLDQGHDDRCLSLAQWNEQERQRGSLAGKGPLISWFEDGSITIGDELVKSADSSVELFDQLTSNLTPPEAQ